MGTYYKNSSKLVNIPKIEVNCMASKLKMSTFHGKLKQSTIDSIYEGNLIGHKTRDKLLNWDKFPCKGMHPSRYF